MRRIFTGSSAAQAKDRWATLGVAMLLGVAEAVAQEQQASRAPEPFSTARIAPSRTSVPRIIVSIPHRKLALIEDGRVLKVYPVAVGAVVTPSPSGEFRIIHRVPRPTYYRPGAVVPPGKENPLGTRWLGLSRKGFGIHGTNEPRSIGRRASHGCIRMRNRDVEELFDRVRVGDVVELRAERAPELARIFDAPSKPSAKPAATPTHVAVAAVASLAGSN